MGEKYNGWSNYETWLVNLWFGDMFNDMAEEGEQLDEDQIETMVLEMLESDGNLPDSGFAADIMNAALRSVDWRELASHYEVVDEDKDEEE
jgi:hypothetical protein